MLKEGYTLVYKSNSGMDVVLHDDTGLGARTVISTQTGLTGVDVEFAEAQNNRVGSTIQGRFVKGKNVTIQGTIRGDSRQTARQMIAAIAPGVPGRLIYNNQIYLDVEPRQTPAVSQFSYNSDFLLVLYAPYPYWKDLAETTIIFGETVGALEFPAELTSFRLGDAYSGREGDVFNMGHAEAPLKAVMQFSGEATGPYVESGGLRAIAEGTFSAGESLVIDTSPLNIQAYVEGYAPFDRDMHSRALSGSQGGFIATQKYIFSTSQYATRGTVVWTVAEDGTLSYRMATPYSKAIAASYDGGVVVMGANPTRIDIYAFDGYSLTYRSAVTPAYAPGLDGIWALAASPDGTYIACAVAAKESNGTTFRVEMSIRKWDGANYASLTTLVTSTSIGSAVSAAVNYSADGSTLFYTLGGSIYLFAQDGDAFMPLSHTLQSSYANNAISYPAISENGKSLAFYRFGALAAARQVNGTYVAVEAPAEGADAVGGVVLAGPFLVYGPPRNGARVAYIAKYDGTKYNLVNTITHDVLSGADTRFAVTGGLKHLVIALEGEVRAYTGGLVQEAATVAIESRRIMLPPGKSHVGLSAEAGADNITGYVSFRQEYVGALL